MRRFVVPSMLEPPGRVTPRSGMTRLRRTLHQLVLVTLNASAACGGSHRPTHTGGGCDGMLQPHTEEIALDSVRGAYEQCGPKPLCVEVCMVAFPNRWKGQCNVVPAEDPTKLAVTFGTPVSCAGRRPRGTACAPGSIATVAESLAAQCVLEGMSVDAFEELAEALAAHDAPGVLIRAACRSAADEVRHAATCRELARRYGANPAALARRTRPAVPSLEALAIDNVVEGEVRETWGAAVATWQAETAAHGRVRRAMRRIARDETRHAELAARIGAWAHGRLDGRGRRRVAQARGEAIATLVRAARAPAPPALVRHLGIPDAADAGRLLGALRATIWS